MKRAAILTLLVFLALPVYAQDWEQGTEAAPAGDEYGAPDSNPGPAPTDEQTEPMGDTSSIETAPPPQQGMPEVEQAKIDPKSSLAYAPISTGFHLELEPGIFMTFGGSKTVSEAAPYIGADIGYDINSNIAFGINFAYAASAASARETNPEIIEELNGAFKDYTMVLADVFFEYRVDVYERLAVLIDAVGGATLLSPQNNSQYQYPQPDGPMLREIDPLGDASDASSTNFNVGLQTGIHYYTYMRHFNLGLELGFYYILPTGIPALAIYPALRYTF